MAPAFLGDTWEYPVALGQLGPWRPVTTAVAPSARRAHQLVFDRERQCVVLFGGTNGATRFDDTWEYDSSGWHLVATPVRPTARAEHCMAWDRARRTVVLFGGEDANGNCNDLWDWTGLLWVPRTVAGPSPSARRSAALVPWKNGLALFGGFDTGVRNDLWLLAADQPGRATVNTTVGCGNPTPPTIAVVPDLQAPYRVPVLGQSLRMRVAGMATVPPFVFFAASFDPSGPVLWPGLEFCGIKPVIDGAWLVSTAQGAAFSTLTVPAIPALRGQAVWFQGVVPAPGFNSLDLAFSGWLETVLGQW